MPTQRTLRLSFRSHFVDQARPQPRLYVPFVASVVATQPGSVVIESQDATALEAHIGEVLSRDPLPDGRSSCPNKSIYCASERPPRSPRATGCRVREQILGTAEIFTRATREGANLLKDNRAPWIGWLDDVERYKPGEGDPDASPSQMGCDRYQIVTTHRLR